MSTNKNETSNSELGLQDKATLPVLMVAQHAESPLHEYAFKAIFLEAYPDRIGLPNFADFLDSLSNLATALQGIEGGVYGQEACDRGMDVLMVNAFASFAKKFFIHENKQAQSIALAFLNMGLSHYEKQNSISRHSEGTLPVLKVAQYAKSPLHKHAFKAQFLAVYHDRIDLPSSSAYLDSLSDLASTLQGIEGGALGQEASDRGMDVLTVSALGDFARKFVTSENKQAQSIALAFINLGLHHYHKPSDVADKPRRGNRDIDSPSLG